MGILTHVDAQGDIGAGRRPGVGGGGRALIRAALHRVPVLENRLHAVAADLHHAHLTSTQGAALRGDLHGRRSAHSGGERVPGAGLGDSVTRHRDLRAGVLEEVGGVVTGVLHRCFGERPCLRALGGGDVDLGARLEVVGHISGELDLLDGRGQHQDAGSVEPEGESGHPLAEVGAVRAAVGGLALVVDLAVVTAAHDDVARGCGVARGHPQFRDLRTQLDRVQAVVDQASGDRHRVGDDKVGEVRVAVEGAVSDGRQALGQDDAAQGRVVRKGSISDGDRALGNRHVSVRLRGKVQDQGAARVALAVQGTVFHGVHRVGGVHGQRGEVVRVHECGFSNGGNARAQVDRGQRGVVGEGTLTDRGHRVGECGGGERRGVEGVVADLGQAIQVGTEIHLGEGLVVAEGTIRQHRGTTQVNALQLGHVPEGRVIHGLKPVRQGQGRDPRSYERTLADVAQMRGQGHGGDLRRGESTLVDECGFLGNGVRTARILRLRIRRQVRQALRVQDTVEALVTLVRGVDLNTLQERSTGERSEEAVGLDVRADGDGAQLRHITEGLEACSLERTRQGNALQGCVCEGALPDRLQLRGVGVVILEGHLGERLA